MTSDQRIRNDVTTVWDRFGIEPATSDAVADAIAADIVARLSDEDLAAVVTGDDGFWRGAPKMAKAYNLEPIVAGALPHHGVPGIRFSDGPRGVVMYSSTAFPTPMVRGAAFDVDLEERVGVAIGLEARAQGANLFAGVCVNLLRHPAWGRAQETYGEDPHHLGEMGAALTRGAQRHVMACVKHYAVNSMENSRFWVDVEVDEATLRDVYLPHFQRIVDEGVAAVMSAYNKVNGTWCGHHHHLLTEILKDEWGFEGFVMSDFLFGVRHGPAALAGGLDLEMPFRLRLRRAATQIGSKIDRTRITDAARRIITTQARFGGRVERRAAEVSVVAGPAHRALAREAAVKGIVLLRNEAVAVRTDGGDPDATTTVPLPTRARRIAVIGKLARLAVTGDHGSSMVRPPEVITVLDGITAAGIEAGATVDSIDGDDATATARLAEWADVAVVVVGTTARDEGEFLGWSGGDRADLRLRTVDVELIEQVAAANPATVVVLLGGSAFITERWRRQVAAIFFAGYPGMEGGSAVADLLFGRVAPSGRLPVTWPASDSQLPPFRRFARRFTYGPLHGYRLAWARGFAPAFPFGFGLSTTTFDHAPPIATGSLHDADGVTITVEVTNTGDRHADEVVFCFADRVLGSHPAALPSLVAFDRIHVPAGATAIATMRVSADDLTSHAGGHPTTATLRIGRDAAPGSLTAITV